VSDDEFPRRGPSPERLQYLDALAEIERLRAALARERRLTALHHRVIQTTRRNCSDCWASDHRAAALAELDR
jgi:hypothetical protein